MSEIAYQIGAAAQHLGGFLRCEQCGYEQSLGDTGHHTAHGWPKHCGYTMRWWTARQIRDSEVPDFPA